MFSFCEINATDGITTIIFSNSPTINELRGVVDKLAADSSYHFRLWDFSHVLFNLSMNEIKQIAAYGKSKFDEKNRLVLVAPQDLAFGMLRAFMVYREEGSHSDLMVFRTNSEAISWLKAEKKRLS